LGLGKKVGVFSTEPVVFKEIKKSGVDTVNQLNFRSDGSKNDAYILCNPGGEETWDRFYSTLTATKNNNKAPLVILNNAYSTTYDLGNKRGYEEGKETNKEEEDTLPKMAKLSGKARRERERDHIHFNMLCHSVTIAVLFCAHSHLYTMTCRFMWSANHCLCFSAYYLKRISKGWVFRQFPDAWQALLEKPDGTVECLKTYSSKPSLQEAATLVREESFKR
jgi:Domain of unknown function (DUF1995)